MLLSTRSPNLYSGVEEASETKPERVWSERKAALAGV